MRREYDPEREEIEFEEDQAPHGWMSRLNADLTGDPKGFRSRARQSNCHENWSMLHPKTELLHIREGKRAV